MNEDLIKKIYDKIYSYERRNWLDPSDAEEIVSDAIDVLYDEGLL